MKPALFPPLWLITCTLFLPHLSAIGAIVSVQKEIRIQAGETRLLFNSTNWIPDAFTRTPHHVKLDAGMLCVFLYGVCGTNGEAHLLNILDRSPATKQRVLEALCWLG